ncbi:methyltransferase domain-containing protein [Candidatus Coxiella mudrowiae]|uniref:methyltransferase domain-containing protein n=1 Tax=Candidatus Coxiella mudrowiae TaxID=2054173 RepID=UPI000C283B1B|nr:methyltransferase domain-containing protein [Candidatus Coxiella mudrowiae]
MKQEPFSIDSQAVAKALEAAAKTYGEGGEIPGAIADRLLERLDFIRLNPLRVVDFGSRMGHTTRALLKRYKKANIISFHFSVSLLNRAKDGFWRRHPKMVVGEYTLLPFMDQSVDLIFSNLTFQWSFDLQKTLQECQRILRPGGLLLFSTVGPDTLKELRASFSDEKRHVHTFYDMHDIGDMLIHLHFVDPVMDMEYLSVRYSSVLQLMADLKAIGAHNAAQDRSRGLMGRNQWHQMLKAYEKCRDENCSIPATIEVIYGHALGSEVASFQSDQEQEVLIPVSHIKRRPNNGKS